MPAPQRAIGGERTHFRDRAHRGSSLLWCAHHFAFFEDALDAFGAIVLVDERLR